MKYHPKQTLIICITAAILLTGCTAAALQMQMDSSSAVSPSESQSEENTSEPAAEPENHADTLTENQADYVQSLAKYIHEPTEEPEKIKQNPYYVALILDTVWTEGQRDGTMAQSENAENYGQVLVPITKMNQLSLQLFGFECDEEYVRSIYDSSDNENIVYYPTDRPFFTTQILDAEFEGEDVSALVEVTPAGEDGRSQGVLALKYNFKVLSSGKLQLVSIGKSELASYTENLSAFFHSPVQSTKEIPLDDVMAYFLVYQTFNSNGAENFYTRNETGFWEIPESDILQTAEMYLGLSDFSISDIDEWPFHTPENGICYYTNETSLPYSNVTIKEVSYSKETGEAAVLVESRDNQYEDSSQKRTLLAYHFVCAKGNDGKNVYCLKAIDAVNG